LGETRIASTVSAGAERGPDGETKRSRTGNPVRGPGGENGLSRGKSTCGAEKAYQAGKTGAWAAKTKRSAQGVWPANEELERAEAAAGIENHQHGNELATPVLETKTE
jgi:hypothetical protein